MGVTDDYRTDIAPGDLAELYRSADMLVACSAPAEGFGLPPVEAMASGTPTVLTRIPAFTTYAAPADYARFVEVGDIDDLVCAIVEVATDDALRRRLIARGHKVAADYDLAKACRRFESVLESLQVG
jgi:glycosyltransferase involved in cell wall biosynthesis